MKKIIIIMMLITLISSCDVSESEPVTITDVTSDYTKKTEKPVKEVEKNLIAPFEVSGLDEGLSIKINKVENISKLKIYLTYENKTGGPISPCESLSKIVSNGEQQEYNLNMNTMLIDDIENSVKKDSVLVFKKIDSNKFNLVINVNYVEYRINNIIVK